MVLADWRIPPTWQRKEVPMRQTISLLLAGMLLLAACSASGAGTIETAAVYEAGRAW